ncbi:sensor histidine kinase [Herbaspirillum sp. HC18]|nr:sensor histidine kinase [Herbaspirillum sp. HC18]
MHGGKVNDLLEHWLSAGGFVSYGHGYLRMPELLPLYMLTDVTSGIAEYSIAAAILYLGRKRRDLQFNWIFTMFAVFIFACGTSHFLSIWTVGHPDYWLDLAVKTVTACVSVVTAIMLWPQIPKAMNVPTTVKLRKAIDQLEHEIEERKKAEEALRQSQATLRELAAYQERIREDERKRIAREIHDELGQNLLALRLDISALHARTSERHPRLQERTTAALEYIDTTLKSIRAIMNNLRPSVLDLGLQAAIEWQVVQFERRNGVPCEVAINDDGQRIPEAQATAVFRILQESLNNIGRHASASFVRIEVRIDERHLVMAIRDNGIGMYPGDRRKARRFGLIGIEERVTILGGQLNIDSKPGQGTVLQMVIPLQVETVADTAAAEI